jgi:hypothetical protein
MINEQVITMDITKVFKTTNPPLPLVAKKEIKTLYWKIDGIAHIRNNELMLWFVKGSIVEQKGHLINWVVADATTTKEKGSMHGYNQAQSRKIIFQ